MLEILEFAPPVVGLVSYILSRSLQRKSREEIHRLEAEKQLQVLHEYAAKHQSSGSANAAAGINTVEPILAGSYLLSDCINIYFKAQPCARCGATVYKTRWSNKAIHASGYFCCLNETVELIKISEIAEPSEEWKSSIVGPVYWSSDHNTSMSYAEQYSGDWYA